MGTNGSDFTSGLLNEWGKYIQAASGFADLKHLVRIADAENETGPKSGLFVKELYSYQKSGVAWLKSYAISSFRTIWQMTWGRSLYLLIIVMWSSGSWYVRWFIMLSYEF
jgi:hypothetical protein